MTEQWRELKETITEMRDNDGTCTQQEVCKFLVNYMEVLEKQMQEPILDKIRAEIMQLYNEVEVVDYDHNDISRIKKAHWITREEVLWIIDKYNSHPKRGADMRESEE